MIFEFFLNACVLISFISIAYIGFKDKVVKHNATLSVKIATGLIGGLLGTILLICSAHSIPHIVIDFRYLPILLVAIYSGVLSTMTATIIIGGVSFFGFGISESSICGLVVALVIGIGFSVICNYMSSTKNKWVFSIIYMVFVFCISLLFVSEETIAFFEIIAMYIIGNLLVSYIIYTYTEYLCDTVRLTKKLKDEATTDFLTGLNNVRQFDKSFNNISKLALRKEESLSILFVDIDFFKKINDTYGHTAGDILLKGVAEILLDTVRAFDIVSRNGGDEFSVLLLDCSPDHAIRIAERLRKKIEMNNVMISDKIYINITISTGVSSYPTITKCIDELLEDADKALYEAKRTGRNKVECTKIAK